MKHSFNGCNTSLRKSAMYGTWIDKIQTRCVSICIIFFSDRSCHISSTSRDPKKHIPGLVRVFQRQGIETLASEVVSVSYTDHWGGMNDKYMWRYLMHFAGFRIVNQDGTFSDDVDEHTWDDVKLQALSQFEFFTLRPALGLIAAESKRRRRPFLPRQAVQRLLRDASERLRYNRIESAILELEKVPDQWFKKVIFRNGKVRYEI